MSLEEKEEKEEDEEEEGEKGITLELMELVDRINRLLSSLPIDLQRQQDVRQGVCRAIFLSHSFKPINTRSLLPFPSLQVTPRPCVDERPDVVSKGVARDVDELPVVKENGRNVPVGAAPGTGAAGPVADDPVDSNTTVVEAQRGFVKARSEVDSSGYCYSSSTGVVTCCGSKKCYPLGNNSIENNEWQVKTLLATNRATVSIDNGSQGFGDSSSSHHYTIDGGVLGVAIPATSRKVVLPADLKMTEEAKVGTRSSTSERRCGRNGASGDDDSTRSGDYCAAAITTTTTTATARPVKTKNDHRREGATRNVPGQSPDAQDMNVSAHDCHYAEPLDHHNQTSENDQASALPAAATTASTLVSTTIITSTTGRRGGGESIPSSSEGFSDDDAHQTIDEEAMMRAAAAAAAAAKATRRITGIAAGEGSISSSSSSSSSSLQYQESDYMTGTQTEEDETTEKESLDATTSPTSSTGSDRDGGWDRVGGGESQIDFLNDFHGLVAEARRGTSYYHDVSAAVESGAEADDEKE